MFTSKFSRCEVLRRTRCRMRVSQLRYYCQQMEEKKFTTEEETKILQVINKANIEELSGYNIPKGRVKKLSKWLMTNGQVKNLADVESAEGFTQKTAKKLFDSILEGPVDRSKSNNKIKGQVLDPVLTEDVRKNCKTVVSIFVAVNSVSWTLIDRAKYEVLEWHYHPIEHTDGKKYKLTDIVKLSWQITSQLPSADVYVMKGEATTLRAAGSDPNNPKMIAVNLQKAQMIAMAVALINARGQNQRLTDDESKKLGDDFQHKVYFLRPTLPYRLYGTLVGKEKVSTEQTTEMLLNTIPSENRTNKSQVYISERLKTRYRAQKDLEKDMLGHCLLLGLTFMDLCVYKNQDSIDKLLKRGE